MPDYLPGWAVDVATQGWLPNSEGTISRLTYINDAFTTPEDPVSSPRICEPGPRQYELFQNQIGGNSVWFIDCNSRLTMRSPNPNNWGDLYLYGAGLQRTYGLGILSNFFEGSPATNAAFGFGRFQGGTTFAALSGTGMYFASTGIYAMDSGGGIVGRQIGVIDLGKVYEAVVLCRNPGSMLLIKGPPDDTRYSEWTMLYVDDVGNHATVYPSYWVFRQDGYIDNFRVAVVDDVSPEFYDDFNRPDSTDIGLACGGNFWGTSGVWEIVSNRLVGTATAAAIATAGQAEIDYLVECTSQASAGTQSIRVRQEGPNDYIEVSYTIGGNFEINEVNAGVPTPLGTPTTPTIAANTDVKILVVVYGNQITAYLDGRNSISATIPNKLTGIQVGMAKDATQDVQFDDFYVWPRTLEIV